jgi:hypothetical protein
MKSPNNLIKAKLQNLSRRLCEFRRMEGARRRPPQELWDEAVALCAQATVPQVATGIGVSASGLRIQHKRARIQPNAKGLSQQRFFEVQSLAVERPICPVADLDRGVELSRNDGSRMKITDLGAHGLDLRTMIQGFMASAQLPTRESCK